MKHGFFEGWYYKLQKDDAVIAFIPGWHMEENGEESSFLQIAYQGRSYYFPYPYAAFSFLNDPYEIILDRNFFNKTGISLDFHKDGLSVKGNVRFGFLSEIGTSRFAPDIMGPFSYVPGMECRHDVISMGHSLKGSLTINGETIDFTGGKGYIERDCGSSFPASWLWCQCNDFNVPCELMLAVAKVPCAGLLFNGLICSLMTPDGEYRFATYNGGRVTSAAMSGKTSAVTLKKGRYTLHVTAKNDEKATLPLFAPVKGGMDRPMKETISCGVCVELQKDNKTIYQASGRHGGFEQVGEPLLSGHRVQLFHKTGAPKVKRAEHPSAL